MGNQQSSAGGFSPIPSGGLYLNGAQNNVSNVGLVKVTLDMVSADFTDGIEDTANNKITPGVAGWYLIAAQVVFSNTVVDKKYSAFLKVSGSSKRMNYVQASQIAQLSLPLMALLKLSNTDYIDLWVDNRDGDGAEDLLTSQKYTYLFVQKVR